jgi:hypothetical protein
MEAAGWGWGHKGVCPLFPAVYCAAARELTGPVLSEYNRANASRYRLRIGKAPRNQPKLTPKTEALLQRFALSANKVSLHPLDWKRFYALVRDGRQQLTEERMRQLLIDSGFAPAKAEHLADVHDHLWALKRVR